MYRNGFTLLELLIVIGVIGLISTVAVMYLDDSKNKGANAAVQSALVNGRDQAELYYNFNGQSYEGVCANDPLDENTIGRFMASGKRAYGGSPRSDGYANSATYPNTQSASSQYNVETCNDNTLGYAAWIPLRDTANGSPVAWCVDSRNASRRVCSNIGAASTQCPAADSCP